MVDHQVAFLSSASFTHQGQEKNIEAGVILHDPHFATILATQWRSLIHSNLVRQYPAGGAR